MKSVNVLVIGAGISGVSIAYHLARKGVEGIHVLDRGYFTNGATGRCGAGVRQQWASKTNCELAKRSIDFFEHAKETLNYAGDLEFKQEGYLILAIDKEEEGQFKRNVALQNEVGIPSRMLTRDEALAVVPHLNRNAFMSASFCPTDGHLNPFKMTEAFYLEAKRLGVTFSFFEELLSIETKAGRIVGATTDRTTYRTEQIVNAAGGYAREVGLMAGIDIPVYSENHQILVTEPIERMQGPMVISFKKNIYCQQVPHGSFLMGRSDPDVKPGHDTESTWRFLDEMAKTLVDIMPAIGKLRVIRQWGGSYNMSKDRQPIISDVANLDGFYLACGFSGHGFMFAPMTGLLISEMMTGEKMSADMDALSLERFENMEDDRIERSVV
ncbi:MAG: NAD(P)/FAD-dependent oxidoreductase [Acholeplasmataceae bacterium]